MMSDPEIENTSPPLPSRGAYSFNFDDVDEFSNPFQSSHGLGNSPLKPDIESPFQTKSKLSQDSQKPQDSPKPSQDSPKLSQDSPKPLQDSPKPSQDLPKLSQDSPKPSQDLPKPSQDLPKLSQDSPKPLQDSPKPSTPVTEIVQQDRPRKRDVTPEARILTTEPDLEASPQSQTYYSTDDNIDGGSLGVPSGSILSIESEDVWCDAQETVGSVIMNEPDLTNDKACDEFNSQPKTASSEHIANQKLSNNIGLEGDHSTVPDVDSRDSIKRSAQKSQDEARQSKKSSGKRVVKSKSPAKVGEAGEMFGESEMEKRSAVSKAGESMDEFEEIEAQCKIKKITSKPKEKIVVEEGDTDVKSPLKNCNLGKEGQIVEEKDTDTKLQDVAVRERNESILPEKSGVENDLPKKRTTGAKRKTKSKLKKPAVSHTQGSDEIQIYAPPKPKTVVENAIDSNPDHMAHSLEMVHEFGAGDDGEMPEEANEGFVPASEVFTDTAAWEMLDKFSGDGEGKDAGPGRESMFINHDPHALEGAGDMESAKRKGLRSGSETRDEAAPISSDELLNASGKSSGSSRQSKVKHPAARVLEEKLDTAASGEPHELNGDQVIAGKSAMAADSKDAIVHLVQVLKYSQTDWNKKHQELDLDFQAQVLVKEKEWSKKLGDRDKKISNLEEQSRHMRQTNEDMRMVITEFEKTISLLQADKEKNSNASQQSLQEAIRERDQASEDLHSVEAAFAGLHQRYEKTKAIIDGFKQNESVLKKCLEEAQSKLRRSEEKLLALKKQAEDKFERVNMDLEKERRSHSTEIARLQAAVKKSELQIQGLEMSLQQKIQENQELTSICDELIAKVGIE